MLRSKEIRRLLAERDAAPEPVEDWCNRNGVEQSVLLCVIGTYAGLPDRRVIALVAFQLGYDARKEQEPRGRAEGNSAKVRSDRFGVEFVVVDRATGTIVSNAHSSYEQATDLANLYSSACTGGASSDDR